MNKLRKIGLLVVAAICALFIFVSCGKPKGPTAEQAAARISTTVDKTTVTGDFVVNSAITLEGVTFTVTWTSDNAIATIGTDKYNSKGEKVENGAFYLVSIAYQTNFDKDQNVTLTATVANGDDKATKTISFTVPKFATASYADYAAADKGAALTVDGIVTGILSKTKGDQDDALYLNALDSTGGFYVYKVPTDPVTAGIKEGMTVRVSGTKDLYSGTYEIINPTVTITDETIKTVTPVDFTEAYLAAADLKAETLTKQALLVTLKGVTITTSDESNGYYKFKLGDKESYIRISSSNCPLNVDETAAFKEGFASHGGWIANATGVVCVYNGNFYLTPVSADAFEYVSLPQLSDAEQVATEKENLSLDNTAFAEAAEITLPVAGKAYTGVTISWTCASEQVTIDNTTGKATIVLGEEKVTTKLVATLTKGTEITTKEIEITISAKSKNVYVATPITEAAAGTFVIIMDTTYLGAEKGKVYYFNGELNDKGALKTSTNVADAAQVVVEVVEGGYALKVGTKYLEGYVNGSYKNLRFADTAQVWKWNTDLKTFTFTLDGVDYYVGDRDRGGYSNDTLALNDIKYATGDNLSKVGKSQFVGYAAKLEVAVPGFKPATAAAAGEFVIAMDTTYLGAEKGKVYYFNGELNDKGALKTSTNTADAAQVVVEVVEGGYALKVGTKYLEGYVNGSYKNLRFADTAQVWKWNTDLKTFTFTLDGVDYYVGDRDRGGYSNDTMALNDIKYATGDNLSKVGKSQFVGCPGTIELVAGGTVVAPEQGGNTGTTTPEQGGNTGTTTPESHTGLPSNLTFADAANKASADEYWAAHYSNWTITGTLGQTYGGYSGFGRSGDKNSSIKSSKIETTEEFTISVVLKGNGSNGVMTSKITFELVDASGNVVATGKAAGATDAAIMPADGVDTTYEISFTFVSGKTWTDVSNLKITFAKETGNIGLKSLTWNK